MLITCHISISWYYLNGCDHRDHWCCVYGGVNEGEGDGYKVVSMEPFARRKLRGMTILLALGRARRQRR